jgi:hypothetical protein
MKANLDGQGNTLPSEDVWRRAERRAEVGLLTAFPSANEEPELRPTPTQSTPMPAPMQY